MHFTVRAIEAHRSEVPPHDPLVSRCVAALRRAATGARPAQFRLAGLTLTPSGVMACAYPQDDAADVFASRLENELGDDAWFEAQYHRDIWYATLVHFTGEVRDRQGLVDWVAARRRLDLGVTQVDVAELLRFRYDGRQPVRHMLYRAPLGLGLVPNVPATAR